MSAVVADKINRTTMSKSTKEKLRYLATTVAEYEEALVSIAEQRALDMFVSFPAVCHLRFPCPFC